MYCDLNIIPTDQQSSLHQLLTSAICDGYSLLSVNTVVTMSQLKLMTSPKVNDIDNEMLKQIYMKNSIQFLNCFNSALVDWSKVRVYKRLTLLLTDPKDLYYLTNPTANMKAYDILAVKPTTDSLLELCLNGDINCDIIIINLEEKLNLIGKKHLLLSSAGKDAFFEVEYSSFVANNESRSSFISNFLMLYQILKGKNMVISSGASNFFEHRSPYDVMTIFNTLLNVDNDVLKKMVCDNAEMVILKSIQRKLYKNTIDVQFNKDSSK